jgi:hypothetical protein
MTGVVSAFSPDSPTGGVSLAVTTSSASVNLPATPGDALWITNTGANTAWVALAATASLSGLPILAGTTALIACGPYASVLSALTAASTTTLYLVRGTGTQH